MTAEVKNRTREFLARFFQHLELDDDQDIFALGFVNSLFAMQLVLFVEKEFAMSIENDDLDIDNFRSLNAIANMVEQKTAARQMV